MTAADALAREIADLRRRLTAVERTAQLPHSSIDAGSLVVKDEDGTQVLQIGRQEDGSYSVTGVNGGQVVASDVLAGIVDDLALADAAVTDAKIAVGAVTTTKITDDAITTPKIVAGAVQAGNIAAGAVVAGKIAANAVTAGNIAALAVTAGNIAANAVTATNIAAGAIATDRLAVGGTTGNLVADPSFESADMRTARLAGTAGAQAPTGPWGFDTGSALPRNAGQAFIKVTADVSSNKKMYLTPEIPTKAGDIFLGSAAMLASGSPSGNMALGVRATKQDGSTVFLSLANAATASLATSWTVFTGQFTMPANTISVAVYIETNGHTGTGQWNADAVEVRRVVAGVEIADGAITAAKIAAGTITADKIAAGALTAGVVSVGTTSGQVLIDPTPPAGLSAFWASAGPGATIGDANVRMLPGDGSYFWTLVRRLAGNYTEVDHGITGANGNVHPGYSLTYFPTTDVIELDLLPNVTGDPTATRNLVVGGQNAIYASAHNQFSGPVVFGGDIAFGSASLGRGVVLMELITNVFTTTGATATAQVAYTTANISWQPNRAYLIEHYGAYRAASLTRPSLQIRKTDFAGTILVEGPRLIVGQSSSGTDDPGVRVGHVVNNTGSVVNAPLALVLTQNPTVVQVTLQGATGPSASWIKVTDVGATAAVGGLYRGVQV